MKSEKSSCSDALREGAAEDVEQILELNEGAIPAVNRLDLDAWRALHAAAEVLFVYKNDERVSGFLLAFVEGADYDSDNYRWFAKRYERFTYIDRVVVSSSARGSGIGRLLYEKLEVRARRHGDVLCCEVNLRPPNEASVRFHQRLGFKEVGQQDTEAGSKRVSLMAKTLG